MTHSRAQIPKGKMPDTPEGTQREYASTVASNSKLQKGKTVKHSVTGLHKSTSTTTAVPCISGNIEEQQSTDDQIVHIPAVPMLQSLPPRGPHAISVTPTVGLATYTTNDTVPSSNIAGTPITTDTASATTCTAPIIQLTS